MHMGEQITWDLSSDLNRASFYGACWAKFKAETLAGADWSQYKKPVESQFEEGGQVYGEYVGETGVTLFNKRNHSSIPGCLMRKARDPIDFSVISRVELDVTTSSKK